MTSLSENDLLIFLLATAMLLVVGRSCGEIARRLNQPEVLGEFLGGVILGPSLMGHLIPGWYHSIFQSSASSMVLSGISWIGAIFLLMIAGMESDLSILKNQVRPGTFAAFAAIVSSLVAGIAFAALVFGKPISSSIFLGVVLSVSAVSIAAKILIERGVVRRDYAQVILAGGVISEVIAWLLVTIAASLSGGNVVVSGIRAGVLAILYFAFMLTIGRKVVFRVMRGVADCTGLIDGQLSLVVVITFLSAALTQFLGLHALLGAFVAGFLLSQSPRATLHLKEKIQNLTVACFAPIFFVVAGARVDLFKLTSIHAVMTVVLLFVVATFVKVLFATAGARLGGLRGWAPLMVGVGLNLKGGSDVVVAMVGTEIGLLSPQEYTAYAVVTVLTVLVSPLVMSWLAERMPPSKAETQRLKHEEAKRRAYLSDVERILAPAEPELLPQLSAEILNSIAAGKKQQKELLDITVLLPKQVTEPESPRPKAIEDAGLAFETAAELNTGDIVHNVRADGNAAEQVISAAKDYRVIVLGAERPTEPLSKFSLGPLQDKIIAASSSDVLVVLQDAGSDAERRSSALPQFKNILVPINGLEYSLAAADVAAYIAKSNGANLTFFNVMQHRMDGLFWREDSSDDLLVSGYRILQEARFRTSRLQVKSRLRVRLSDDVSGEILRELHKVRYDLVVIGAVNRGMENRLYLGKATETLICGTRVPVVLFVSHTEATTGAAIAA